MRLGGRWWRPMRLVEALTQHRIRAALDVTDPEPLPAGHPLWLAPNCMITPHVGDRHRSLFIGRFGLGRSRCDGILAGEPLENVVLDAGY